MLAGIVGAPNKGKSTLFSALTMAEVHIADYPFTTIKPNTGTAYITKKCVDRELGVKCTPQNSSCVDGVRMIPVRLIDVAGLVEGAHQGRGMGNQFLNDLSAADALIVVADSSGGTDTGGNQCSGCDPSKDVDIVVDEMSAWLSGILVRHLPLVAKSKDAAAALAGALAGLRISRDQVSAALKKCGLPASGAKWSSDEVSRLSRELMASSKPMLIAANKSDLPNSDTNIAALKVRFGAARVVACSAAIELALRKAEKQGLISYNPNGRAVKVLRAGLPDAQASAIDFMARFVRERGTGVQELIDTIYLNMLDNIVVYPVEDENTYKDGSGNVLPDAVLIKRGSTALDLADSVHTEIGKGMLYAIDARTKMRLGKDYVLKDGDVVKIVSSAKQK